MARRTPPLPWARPIDFAAPLPPLTGRESPIPRVFVRPLYVNWVDDTTGERGRDKCGSVMHPYYALSPEDYTMRFWSVVDDILVGIDAGARSLWRMAQTRQDDRITGTILPRKEIADHGRAHWEAVARLHGKKH